MSQEQDLPARLRNGAKLLGDLWRAGLRCASGWAPSCSCLGGKTKFCRAKEQWALLAPLTRNFAVEDTPFGVVEAMLRPEIEAVGRTLSIETPEVGTWKAGPAGVVPIDEIYNGWEDGWEEVRVLLMMFKVFPGSTVVKDAPDGKGQATPK